MWNYSLDEGLTIESIAGVEYNDCCWRLRLAHRRYLQEPQFFTVTSPDPNSPGNVITDELRLGQSESRILLEIQFKGLGQSSGRLDTLLERSIPGYRQREDSFEE